MFSSISNQYLRKKFYLVRAGGKNQEKVTIINGDFKIRECFYTLVNRYLGKKAEKNFIASLYINTSLTYLLIYFKINQFFRLQFFSSAQIS